MPDHIHMVWMGITDSCNQLSAMKHFRKTLNESLGRIGYSLQDQSYDHVLRDEERRTEGFLEICNYIARNPERAELVEPNAYASYPFTNCLVPGYPELRFFDKDYWNKLDKVISFLRKEGLHRS